MIKKIFTIILFALSIFAQQNPLDQNQFMLAESYEQNGDLNKAVEIIESLNKKDPSNIQYFNKLNSLYLQLKNYDKSVELINSRILLTPQDISLYGMLGSTYYTAGNPNKAYQVWDDAIEKFNSNQMTFRIIVNYVIEKRDFEKAIELLNRGKAVSKDPFLYSYDLGQLYNITMRYKEAAEEYCDLLRENPSQYPIIESKILSYLNKPDALDETIEVVEKYKSDNISFIYLLARLYIEKKNYDEAFKLYKEIDNKQNNDGSDLFSFGEYVYRENEFETASKIFGYLIETYPTQKNIQTARLYYAKTLEAMLMEKYNKQNPEWKHFYIPATIGLSETEPVIKAYEQLIKDYQHSMVAVEANLRIGILLFHLRDDIPGAKNYFNIIIKDYSTSKFAAPAFIELGIISIMQAKLNEAENYFHSVENLRNANDEDKNFANYYLAKAYSFSGNFEAARKTLSSVLDNLRNNIANDAIEFSILLNTAKNDSSNLSLYCKGEFLVEQRKFNKAKEIFNQLSQNPQAFVFHSIAKLRVAQMLIALDDYSSAIANLQLIVDEAEKNIYADKALYLQGQIYQYGVKDFAKAVESYESLLARFPKSLYLDEARKNIIELKKNLS